MSTSGDQIKAAAGTSIDVTEDADINDFLFLMPISLWTPPVMNLVGIDTGSTLSWVQCQPCQPRCHTQAAKAGQIFDPSRSTTFRRAGCKSRECIVVKNILGLQFANCMEKENTCLYSMTYGTGWAYTVGKVAWDNLIIQTKDTNISLSFLFGCSLDVEYSNYKEAGIVGFGYSSFSFFEQVSRAINYKAFSYCFARDETMQGYMILGDCNREGVDGYTPMFKSTFSPTYSLTLEGIVANGQSLGISSSEMVVDSGSFWTVVSTDTFGRLDKLITEAMVPLNYLRRNFKGLDYICFESEADSFNWNGKHTPFSNWSSLPTVEMAFTGAATLPLPPQNLFYNDPHYGLCTTFTYMTKLRFQILGNRATRSFETIFDIQGNMFGFRYSAC